MLMLKRNYLLVKFLSILLAISISPINAGFGMVSSSAPKLQSPVFSGKESNLINDITIPELFGTIDCVWEPADIKENSQKIVLIKDAHCNYEAQHNIAKILEILVRDYKVDLVAVEGAVGEVDLEKFGKTENITAREKAADMYVKKGLVTGSEYLRISKYKELPFGIYGIEDGDLYVKNFIAFRETMSGKKETEQFINEMSKVINALKVKLYSKELLDFDKKAVEYEENKMGLTEWATLLAERMTNDKIQMTKYKDFVLVLRSIDLEERIDFKRVEKEREELIKYIEKNLPKEEIEQIVKKSLLFKLGKISSLDYYRYLEFFTVRYPLNAILLRRYIHLVKLQSKMDGNQLFKEIDGITYEIKDKLFQNNNERTLGNISTKVNILKKLFNLQLGRTDMQYFKDHKSEFFTKELISFIMVQAPLNNIVLNPMFGDNNILQKIDSYIIPGDRFYEEALLRDDVLVKNTIAKMEKENKNTAVMITGGFHADGIKRILQDKNISYSVITPKITKVQENCPYLPLMMDERIKIPEAVPGGENLAVPELVGEGSNPIAEALKIDGLRTKLQEEIIKLIEKGKSGQKIEKDEIAKLGLSDADKKKIREVIEAGQVTGQITGTALMVLNLIVGESAGGETETSGQEVDQQLSEIEGDEVWMGQTMEFKVSDILDAITNSDLAALERFVDSLGFSSELARELKELIKRQNEKASKMAFLAPDAGHILRAIKNAEKIMENKGISEAMEVAFGSPQKALKVAQVAVLLSKIGFGDERFNPSDRNAYKRNRIFAMNLLETVKDMLKEGLDITDEQYFLIREAILREGTFGIGTERRYDDFEAQMIANGINIEGMPQEKYKNPLTALLTIASEADISEVRLQPWQKEPVLIRALSRVYSSPVIVGLYAERNNLEIQKGRAILKKQTRKVRKIDKLIAKQRSRFNYKLRELIEKEVLGDSKIIELGQSKKDKDKQIYKQIVENINNIDSESYLWYAGSFHVSNVSIEDGRIVIVSHLDKSTDVGAAANLPHIIYFHSNRLEGIVSQVNQGLGLKGDSVLELKRKKERKDNAKYQIIEKAPKTELHAHLAMSVDFDLLWDGIVGSLIKKEMKEEDYQKALGAANKSLEAMKIEGVDLEKIFGMAKETVEQLIVFLEKYGSNDVKKRLKIGLPKRIDYLAEDAQKILENVPPEMQVIIQKQIYQYNMLKHQIRHLFNFQEGALTKFVKHFAVVSKMQSIIASDKLGAMRRMTMNLLDNYSRDNVVYVETRFNIGVDKESTKREVLTVIRAYKEWVEKNKGLGITIPELKIILSITKMPDESKPDEEREKHKTDSAQIFVDILKEAREHIDEPNYYGTDVSPRDVLDFICGIDAAGQEEYNPPKLFEKAYSIIRQYNETVPEGEKKIILTHHVSESITDVSVESGIRYSVQAMTMLGMDRLGHNIIPAIPDFSQFRGKAMTERVSERIDQIDFDLKLLEEGVPLFSVTEEGLRKELEELRNKGPNELVSYNYDTDEKIQDLKTRAGYALDLAIRMGIVIETNPTSNLGISPYLPDYKSHTLKTYLSYTHGRYFKDLLNKLDPALHKAQIEWIQEYLEKNKTYNEKKAKVIISTDDLTLFDTTVTKEIYRVLEALKEDTDINMSIEDVLKLIEESFRYAARFKEADTKKADEETETGGLEGEAVEELPEAVGVAGAIKGEEELDKSGAIGKYKPVLKSVAPIDKTKSVLTFDIYDLNGNLIESDHKIEAEELSLEKYREKLLTECAKWREKLSSIRQYTPNISGEDISAIERIIAEIENIAKKPGFLNFDKKGKINLFADDQYLSGYGNKESVYVNRRIMNLFLEGNDVAGFIALFHEVGHKLGYLHTKLRGLGKKARQGLRSLTTEEMKLPPIQDGKRLGLQDILFGEENNNLLTIAIPRKLSGRKEAGAVQVPLTFKDEIEQVAVPLFEKLCEGKSIEKILEGLPEGELREIFIEAYRAAGNRWDIQRIGFYVKEKISHNRVSFELQILDWLFEFIQKAVEKDEDSPGSELQQIIQSGKSKCVGFSKMLAAFSYYFGIADPSISVYTGIVDVTIDKESKKVGHVANVIIRKGRVDVELYDLGYGEKGLVHVRIGLVVNEKIRYMDIQELKNDLQTGRINIRQIRGLSNNQIDAITLSNRGAELTEKATQAEMDGDYGAAERLREESRRYSKMAYEYNKDIPTVLTNYASSLINTDKTTAEKVLQDALRIDPESIETLLVYIRWCMAQRDFQKGNQMIARVKEIYKVRGLKYDEDFLELLCVFAELLLEKGDYNGAYAAVQDAGKIKNEIIGRLDKEIVKYRTGKVTVGESVDEGTIDRMKVEFEAERARREAEVDELQKKIDRNKREIDRMDEELKQMDNSIEEARGRIDRYSQSSVDNFNAMVREFQAKQGQRNDMVPGHNKMAERLRSLIDRFNADFGKNGVKVQRLQAMISAYNQGQRNETMDWRIKKAEKEKRKIEEKAYKLLLISAKVELLMRNPDKPADYLLGLKLVREDMKVYSAKKIAEICFDIGNMYFSNKDWKQAAKYYQNGIEILRRYSISESDALYKLFKSNLQSALANTGDVGNLVGDSGADARTQAIACLNAGNVSFQGEDWRQAIENYRRGIDVCEKKGLTDSEVYGALKGNLGNAVDNFYITLLNEGKHEEIIRDNNAPNSLKVKAYLSRGNNFAERTDQVFSEGILAFERGDWQMASIKFDEVVRLYNEAIRNYEMGIELDPSNTALQENRRIAVSNRETALGNRDAARSNAKISGGRAVDHQLSNRDANDIIQKAKGHEDVVGLDNIKDKLSPEEWENFKRVCELAGFPLTDKNVKLIIVDTDEDFKAHYGNVRMTGGEAIRVFVKKSLMRDKGIGFTLAHEFLEGQKLRGFIQGKRNPGESLVDASARLEKNGEMNRLEDEAHHWAERAVLKGKLRDSISGIGDVRDLKQVFFNMLDILEQIEEGQWVDRGYTTYKDVKWHDFTHAGTSTLEGIKALLEMKKQGVPISDEAIMLTGIAGMMHDIGYYIPNMELGVGYETIKVDHEQRSMEFVMQNYKMLGLTERDLVLVCLIIAGTQVSVTAGDWNNLGEKIEIAKIEGILKKVLGENFNKSDIASVIGSIDVTDIELMNGVIDGAKILATLDIYDSREDALQKIYNLREEFKRDYDVIMRYLGMLYDRDEDRDKIDILVSRVKALKPQEKSAEKVIEILNELGLGRGDTNKIIAKSLIELTKIALSPSGADQIAGTKFFNIFYADPRVKDLGVLQYVSNSARQNIDIARAVVFYLSEDKGTLDDLRAKGEEYQRSLLDLQRLAALSLLLKIGVKDKTEITELKKIIGENPADLAEALIKLLKQDGDVTEDEIKIVIEQANKVEEIFKLSNIPDTPENAQMKEKIAIFLAIEVFEKAEEPLFVGELIKELSARADKAGVSEDMVRGLVEDLYKYDQYDEYFALMVDGIRTLFDVKDGDNVDKYLKTLERYVFIKSKFEVTDERFVGDSAGMYNVVMAYRNKNRQGEDKQGAKEILSEMAGIISSYIGNEEAFLKNFQDDKIKSTVRQGLDSLISRKQLRKQLEGELEQKLPKEILGNGIERAKTGYKSFWDKIDRAGILPAQWQDNMPLIVDVNLIGEAILPVIQERAEKGQLAILYKTKEEKAAIEKWLGDNRVNLGDIDFFDKYPTEGKYAKAVSMLTKETADGIKDVPVGHRVVKGTEKGEDDIILMSRIAGTLGSHENLTETAGPMESLFLSYYNLKERSELNEEAKAILSALERGEGISALVLSLPPISPFIKAYYNTLKTAREFIAIAA